ncbi:hypothetical protein OCI51_25985 (plasmid) [Lysinibacillus capsici]|uniref:cyclic-phosphate processing receiver domain-containing protein n=1 Tax=Lysinibacillus capsici TaxID=2115968 RepID=UPI0021D8B683|nr:cyclic-phosphate processing receiver domain-containing protein [Lysinibacillus capsici]UYB50111.1 hypothetical protein OCI51_25985 [Lysinibacillus capsici]
MKINVYLDELRDCPNDFILAKNINELQTLITTHDIGILSLDHDLGTDASGQLLPTGYDFVKWFCEEGLFVEQLYLHTDNVVGKENMYSLLKAAQRRGFISQAIEVYPRPFTPNKYSGNARWESE